MNPLHGNSFRQEEKRDHKSVPDGIFALERVSGRRRRESVSLPQMESFPWKEHYRQNEKDHESVSDITFFIETAL